MSRNTLALALLGAVTAAVSMAAPAVAQDAAAKEKCYGISMAGKNDCASAGNNSCAGTSKVNFEKNAWKYVAKGTCASMEVTGAGGMKHMGSLTPAKM
jgi:uncharacterized membrane protein